MSKPLSWKFATRNYNGRKMGNHCSEFGAGLSSYQRHSLYAKRRADIAKWWNKVRHMTAPRLSDLCENLMSTGPGVMGLVGE